MASKKQYSTDSFKEGTLAEMRYVDSLFGTKLVLTDDGRKRGLWVWIADEINRVVRNDIRIFEDGLAKFKKWLDDPKGYKKEPEMLGFMIQSICFDYFFGHRTESASVRLDWRQAKKLADALLKGIKDEKNKTEEYGFDVDEED